MPSRFSLCRGTECSITDSMTDNVSTDSDCSSSSASEDEWEEPASACRGIPQLNEAPAYLDADLLYSISQSADLDMFHSANGKRPNKASLAEKYGVDLIPKGCKVCHEPKPSTAKRGTNIITSSSIVCLISSDLRP
jgi:hypothetical protein